MATTSATDTDGSTAATVSPTPNAAATGTTFATRASIATLQRSVSHVLPLIPPSDVAAAPAPRDTPAVAPARANSAGKEPVMLSRESRRSEPIAQRRRARGDTGAPVGSPTRRPTTAARYARGEHGRTDTPQELRPRRSRRSRTSTAMAPGRAKTILERVARDTPLRRSLRSLRPCPATGPARHRPRARPAQGRCGRTQRSRRSISATRRSSSVVTLRFSRGAGTTRTVPPIASTSEASSVAAPIASWS
jgi:hypothetical protein